MKSNIKTIRPTEKAMDESASNTPLFFIDGEITNDTNADADDVVNPTKIVMLCPCPECKGKSYLMHKSKDGASLEFDDISELPESHTTVDGLYRYTHCSWRHIIYSPKLVNEFEKVKGNFRNPPSIRKRTSWKVKTLVEKHPEQDDGIVLYNTMYRGYWKEDKPVLEYSVASYAELRPGKESVAHIVKASGDIECPLVEVFDDIKLFQFCGPVVEENHRVEILCVFGSKFPEFCKNSGLKDVYTLLLSQEPSCSVLNLTLYLCLFAYYPNVAEVVKGENWNLLNAMLKKLYKVGCHKSAELNAMIEQFGEIINPTTEKEPLAVPKVVLDYIDGKSFTVSTIVNLVKIFNQGNMCPAEFTELMESNLYRKASVCTDDLSGRLLLFMKYGYKPKQLLEYLVQKAEYSTAPIQAVVYGLAHHLQNNPNNLYPKKLWPWEDEQPHA